MIQRRPHSSATKAIARREAEQATTAVALRNRVQAQATSDGLPTDRELLGLLQRDLSGLRKDMGGMSAAAGRALIRLASRMVARTL